MDWKSFGIKFVGAFLFCYPLIAILRQGFRRIEAVSLGNSGTHYYDTGMLFEPVYVFWVIIMAIGLTLLVYDFFKK